MPNSNTLHNDKLRESIVSSLHRFDRIAIDNSNKTPAAVVIGISALQDTACILLTQRSSTLRQHAGQFALPGGKLDPDESLTEAALRELQEELGLLQSNNNVLGMLDDMPTESGYNITPVVVWIDNIDSLKINVDEVARVYQVPLSELLSMQLTLSTDHWDVAPGDDATHNKTARENDVMSLYLPSVGTTIYSPTAAIIYQFREVTLLGKSTRVAHFGQPRFAWR